MKRQKLLSLLMVPLKKFIGGASIKPATKRFSGVIVQGERLGDLHDMAVFITQIRSPMVIVFHLIVRHVIIVAPSARGVLKISVRSTRASWRRG